MGDDKEAIVATKQPKTEVNDRKLPLSNQSMRVIDEETAEVPDGESDALPKKKKKRSKKVLCLWCCALAGVLLLLLAVIIIILVFTVFKVKDPTIAVTGTNLKSVSLNVGNGFEVSIAAELDTTASVHNPNAVAFKYSNTTIDIFYRGDLIAEAPLAAGEIKAKRTQAIFLPVQVSLTSDDINSNLFNDLVINKALPLVSSVNITGTVKIGIIKIKHVRVSSLCNLIYSLDSGSLSSKCQYKTKI